MNQPGVTTSTVELSWVEREAISHCMENHSICVRFFRLCNPAFISKGTPMYCKMMDWSDLTIETTCVPSCRSVLSSEWCECSVVLQFVSFSQRSELCTEAAFKCHRAENSSASRALQHQRATKILCSSLQTQLCSGWVRAWGACVTADPVTRRCWHAALVDVGVCRTAPQSRTVEPWRR